MHLQKKKKKKKTKTKNPHIFNLLFTVLRPAQEYFTYMDTYLIITVKVST
jgi:hypothetical protein